MAVEKLDVNELIHRASEALDAGRWETAHTYACAALANNPTNFRGLAIAQAAIIEMIAPIYLMSANIQELLMINRAIRDLDVQ